MGEAERKQLELAFKNGSAGMVAAYLRSNPEETVGLFLGALAAQQQQINHLAGIISRYGIAASLAEGEEALLESVTDLIQRVDALEKDTVE